MGVEVIEHQTNTSRLGIIHVDQFTDAFRPVPLGPACRHPDMTPSAQRFATHKWVAHPFALICIVLAFDPPSTQRQGRVDLANQLFAGFVHTNDGIASIVGQLVNLQHVLHVIHEVGIGCGRHAPCFHLPQLELVFFNAWRMVSREARATYPNSTSRSASKRTVQRPCPRGGSPQAKAINRCSTSSVMITLSGRLRGRCGWRAASKLSSTNCCRPRWMVERLTPNASAMASLVYRMPSGLASACSKMRPWSNLRAAPLPDDTIFRSTQRSSSVRVTRNLAMGELLLLKPQIRGEKENRLGSTCQSKIAKLLACPSMLRQPHPRAFLPSASWFSISGPGTRTHHMWRYSWAEATSSACGTNRRVSVRSNAFRSRP